MFPARAGMSRHAYETITGVHNVPRASGDEPYTEKNPGAYYICSPRERG